MSEISLIAGVSPSAVRLLGAVGVQRIDNLARQDAGTLYLRLREADRDRGLMGGDLTPEAVGGWIEGARSVVSSPLRQGRALSATEKGFGDFTLNLDAVPEAIIVTEPPSPEAPAATPAPEPAPAASPPSAGSPPSGTPAAPARDAAGAQLATTRWKEIEKEKYRDFSSYAESVPDALAAKTMQRSPRSGTRATQPIQVAAPRESVPRRVRRGIPHPRPFFVLAGGFIVLLTRLLFLVVLIGTPIALVPAFLGRGTHPLMVFLWIIGGWLVACLLYLMVALRVRCRVCTNQIFFSKRCFKNVKAHRVFGLGLVGSLALHAIIFGWFRCMYCGTAIRLKYFGRPEERSGRA